MLYRDRKGIVYQARTAYGSRIRYRFAWTSDAAGDAGAPVEFSWVGEVAESVEFNNSDGGAETYTVTLIDDMGLDWLLSLGSGKATGAASRAAFVETTVSSAESRPPPIPAGLWFKVDCSATAVRSGIVDIWTRGGA